MHIAAKRDVYVILFIKLKGRPNVGGNIILEWILKNRFAVWTRLTDSE